MYYIENILKLSHKLSFFNLIYKKYNWKWIVTGFLPALIGFSISLVFVIPSFPLYYLLTLIPSIAFIIFSAKYIRKKTQKVVEENFKYALQKDKKWNQETIFEIRKKELKRLINNEELFHKDSIIFLIESIQREIDSQKYGYSFFINTIIVLLSVYLGAFLGGFINYSKDLNEYLSIFKSIGGIVLLIILLVWYIDTTLIKEFVLSRRKKNNRLIRILENIYLENTPHNIEQAPRLVNEQQEASIQTSGLNEVREKTAPKPPRRLL